MSDQDLLLTEQYYRDKLSEADRLAFEQRMGQDEVFQQEALLHIQAMKAIRFHEIENLKIKLGERPVIKTLRPAYYWPWVGIVIAVLICLGYYYRQQSKKSVLQNSGPVIDTLRQREAPPAIILPSGEDTLASLSTQQSPIAGRPKSDPGKLFAASFRPYKDGSGSDTDRSGSTNSDSTQRTDIGTLKQLNHDGKYAELLLAFDQLPKDVQQKPVALFFKANSLLVLGRIDEAAILFEIIAKNPQSMYAGHAKWYAALCALKKGNLSLADRWLRDLLKDANVSNRQRAEAKTLLLKIESLPE